MQKTGYKSKAVAAAVELVNAVTGVDGDDGDDALMEILRVNEFFWRDFETADGESFRVWGRTLRPFFEATDLDEAADLLNGLMLAIPMHPHIANHEPHGVHMHYAPPSARLPDRFRAATLVKLSELVCQYGLGRTGVCAAEGCDRVYADTSRAGRRRFCSETCANRTNVAAFRARQQAGAGGLTGAQGQVGAHGATEEHQQAGAGGANAE